MNKIDYKDLELVVKHNAWDTPFGCLALELEKRAGETNSFYYHDPKEHLKLFLNNWIVEKAFIEAFGEENGLRFNGDDHEYFNGIGHWAVDCVDRVGNKVEIKTFATKEKLERWRNKASGTYDAGYNCDLYLIYVRTTKTSYVYYPKTDDLCKSLYQIDVNLY